jgi:zinc D-Ala-D-Ala carboxypeptidase
VTTYLSPHFTLDELTHSQKAVRRGLDNTPPPDVLENLRKLAQLLEAVRTHIGRPVLISSGYRSRAVNDAVGGAVTSQHLRGQAADFIAPGFGKPATIVSHLMDAPIEFDQLINEGGWVHISWAPKPRRQVLTAHFSANGVVYTPGVS